MIKTTVANKQVNLSGSWLTIARLEDEWHHDIDDPASFVNELSKSGLKADLFSFWQRLPDTEPRFHYYHEPDPIAVLRVTTYDHWLRKQINGKTRNLIGKAQKKSVVVRPASFDAEFINGMMAIFNESPVRQGMRFWHYGKDFETLKKEFSRYLFREEVFGAYVDGELIGFLFLIHAGSVAMLGQIISMIRHRDKSPNNALIAKAVEICAERKIPFLTYAVWPRPGSLRDFKKHNGFECVELPRYYIPLTTKGHIALKFKLHRDPLEQLPEKVVLWLKASRAQYYTWRYRRTDGNVQARP